MAKRKCRRFGGTKSASLIEATMRSHGFCQKGQPWEVWESAEPRSTKAKGWYGDEPYRFHGHESFLVSEMLPDWNLYGNGGFISSFKDLGLSDPWDSPKVAWDFEHMLVDHIFEIKGLMSAAKRGEDIFTPLEDDDFIF